MSSEEDRVAKQRDAADREAAKLWRAWKTVKQMVQDRGYQLSDAEVNINLRDFISEYTQGGTVE